jgi:NADPH:quinone reductase-like Zn-dependent oxidoreductase
VLNSLDGYTLQKFLNVLKPGGKLISISGPPDPDFAREQGLNWFLRQVFRLLSFSIRRKPLQFRFGLGRAAPDRRHEVAADSPSSQRSRI